MADRGSELNPAQVPLIAEHDSWITVDPVVGCPADCSYCFLGPLDLRLKRPVARATPSMLAAAVTDYLGGRRAMLIDPLEDMTPICIGNYTDMVIARPNRRILIEYVSALTEALRYRRPIVVITKGCLDPNTVEELDQLGWPLLWFFSQSMSGLANVHLEDGPIADFQHTLKNAELVAQSRHQVAVHFWRPFVPELRLSPRKLNQVVGDLQSAGFASSVTIGLKRGPGVPMSDPRLVKALSFSANSNGSTQEVFDSVGWSALRQTAIRNGYPVYRSTSCALALATGRRESLGMWDNAVGAKLCHPAVCPRRQRRQCTFRYRDVQPVPLQAITEFLSIEPDKVELDAVRRVLRISAVVGENDFNILCHAFADQLTVQPIRVVAEKAWLGTIAESIERRAQSSVPVRPNSL